MSYTQLYTHTGGVRGAVPDDHGQLYSYIYMNYEYVELSLTTMVSHTQLSIHILGEYVELSLMTTVSNIYKI